MQKILKKLHRDLLVIEGTEKSVATFRESESLCALLAFMLIMRAELLEKKKTIIVGRSIQV